MRAAALFPFLVVVAPACGDGGATSPDAAPADAPSSDAGPDASRDAPAPLTIGGEVRCMAGAGLVLRNGSTSLAIAANGTFEFPDAVADGTPYEVEVETDPSAPAQSCTVENGAGMVSGAPVTNIIVRCSGSPEHWVVYTQGGTNTRVFVRGLDDASCPGPPIDVTPPNITSDGLYMRATADGRFVAMELIDAPSPFARAAYVLDVSSPSFSPAVRADGPLFHFSVSPAGHSLVTVRLGPSQSYTLHATQWSTLFVAGPAALHPAEVFLLDDLVWSPDGALVAYAVTEPNGTGTLDSGNTYAVDVSGGPPYAPRLLGTNCTRLEFAAGGRRLLCDGAAAPGSGEVRVYDLDDLASPRTIVVNPAGTSASQGRITPDGRQVIYVGGVVPARDTFLVDISGATPSTPQRLHPALPDLQFVREIAVSPDSRKVVLMGDLETYDQFEIYGVDISGSSPGPLTRLSAHPNAAAGGPFTRSFLFSRDSSHVSFRFTTDTFVSTLQRASLDPVELASVVSLPSGFSAEEVVGFAGPDEQKLLLFARAAGARHLLAVDPTAALPPTIISIPGREVAVHLLPHVTSTNDGVLFLVEDPAQGANFDLFVMDLDAGLGPQQVNVSGTTGGRVMAATTTPVHQGGASAASSAASASATRGDGPSK